MTMEKTVNDSYEAVTSVKTLVIYDSTYGNTEKIARSMGGAITGDVKVLRASEAHLSDLKSINTLIAGSPTHAFRATEPIRTFIGSIPGGALNGINVAAFDTRFAASDVGTGLRLLMKVGVYAAPRIAKALKKKGGNLAVLPEGFFVKDTEGPLKEGELERAANWAKAIVKDGK
jgi:flavodoxin I